MPELSPEERRGRQSRPLVLHAVLVLRTRLRMGMLAPAVPVAVCGVCFPDDLGRVPRILRVCEVPKPDAVEAESVSALLAFLASNLPHSKICRDGHSRACVCRLREAKSVVG